MTGNKILPTFINFVFWFCELLSKVWSNKICVNYTSIKLEKIYVIYEKLKFKLSPKLWKDNWPTKSPGEEYSRQTMQNTKTLTYTYLRKKKEGHMARNYDLWRAVYK